MWNEIQKEREGSRLWYNIAMPLMKINNEAHRLVNEKRESGGGGGGGGGDQEKEIGEIGESGGEPCQGDNCWCKEGGPCTGLKRHQTITTKEGDVVHYCPFCDWKMFTTKGKTFIEHQCKCGHWGWLHAFG